MTKRISGIYYDNAGFKHIVFYSNKEWIMTIWNPEGKYCSHSHYDSESIRIQIKGMRKENEPIRSN